MKICYLGDAPSPHMRKFVDYFAKAGNEIYVISLRKAEYQNATVYLIPRRTPFEDLDYLLSFFWLRRIIKTINPDILHAHFLTSFGLLGALAGYHPFIVTAWGSDLLITPKISFIHRGLLKFTIKKADLIFADVSFMQEELLRYGASEEKILICPLGVNMDIFDCKDREFKEKGEYSLLSMRALIRNSNIEVIIKSIKILKDKGINVVLNITNCGAEEESMKRMTNGLRLNDRVSFLGFIELEETYKYFKSSDIYLSITTSDGTSVTLLEAMASGLFPIVSDIPANREWIKDGENGFLVSWNDPVTLANKITIAIRENEFRQKATEINRVLIREKGELRRTMESVWDQYKLLAGCNKTPR